jgi:hypothetical protein
MAFADSSTYFDIGDSTILGRFDTPSHGRTFEFSQEPEMYLAPDLKTGKNTVYPHRVWVTNHRIGGEQGWRHALVKKTVAYVVVDEDDNGLVIQKWNIKNLVQYQPK